MESAMNTKISETLKIISGNSMKRFGAGESTYCENSNLSTYLRSSFRRSDKQNKIGLSLYLFDPKLEEVQNEKPPTINKAQQNRHLKEIVQMLNELGFSACALHSSQLNDFKTFSQCFMFAYSRVDENYKFSKKWDDEYLRILKILKFPYHIMRNDLYELSNGRSWPLVLSSLHWLIATATYCQNFILDLSYFEEFDASTADIVKCKWNFIISSMGVESKEQALLELDHELDQLHTGDATRADLEKVEKSLADKQEKLKELEHHQTEGHKLEERISSLASQISKFEECNKSLTDLFEIFTDKSSKVKEEIENEKVENASLKDKVQETKDVIKRQVIDSDAVADLQSQTLLSRKRIEELFESCRVMKEEQVKVETQTREINFKFEDLVSSFVNHLAHITTSLDGIKIKIGLPFTVSSAEWKKEDSVNRLKKWVNEVKRGLNNTYREHYSNQLTHDKEITEKNVTFMELEDQKRLLLQQVNEVDHQYAISEKSVRNYLGSCAPGKDDSLVSLSTEKWKLKKLLEDKKAEIHSLDSKLKTKYFQKEEANSAFISQTNEVLRDLSNITNKLLTKLEQEDKKASLLSSEVDKYLRHYFVE